jgi:hypothetical protein
MARGIAFARQFVDEKPGEAGQGKGGALQPLLKPRSFGMDGRLEHGFKEGT